LTDIRILMAFMNRLGFILIGNSGKDKWLAKGNKEQVTLTEIVNPDKLFEAIVKVEKGLSI
jgi:hypothetical protein